MTLQRLQAAREGWQAEDLSVRLRIPEDRIIVASDVHVPYHDEELLENMFRMARHSQRRGNRMAR